MSVKEINRRPPFYSDAPETQAQARQDLEALVATWNLGPAGDGIIAKMIEAGYVLIDPLLDLFIPKENED